MKIKISEEQAKHLNLLNEDTNPLIQYEQYCNKLINEINKIYVKIININIAEILNKEIDIEKINDYLNNIESKMNEYEKKAYAYIQSNEELEKRIDETNYIVNNKLTPLQLMTMDLERVQRLIEKYNIIDRFKDIKHINVGGA